MNQRYPSRRALPRLQFAFVCAGVFCSLFITVSGAKAQDVAEAARQEKARKAAQAQKQPHVYTNDDLQKTQILAPEEQASVDARKKKPETPALNETLPTNAGVEDASAPESLGEIARRVRREKVARQAEQAGKVAPPSLFHMELPPPTTLAHPKPPSGPLVAPTPMNSKSARPAGTARAMMRDPFSRAIISPAPKSIAPAATVLAPVVPAAVIPPTAIPPVAIRPIPVGAKNHPGSVSIHAGDSLWNLSRQYLGKGSRWQEWISSNPQLADPRRLQPGSTLLVPASAAPSNPGTEPQAVASLELPATGTVSVKSGDSLWRIAAEHFGGGAQWTCLARANPDLQDVDRIYPGQTLRVPASCIAPRPATALPPATH
jgi:nucleoid-associated protein YgaU